MVRTDVLVSIVYQGGTVEPINIGTTQEQQPQRGPLWQFNGNLQAFCLVQACWEDKMALGMGSADTLANIRAFSCITTGPGRQAKRVAPMPKT